MDASYLKQVELIAKAADDVPLAAKGALTHFAQTIGPGETLRMVGEIQSLRAALKEALDGWDARERDVWESTGGGAYGPFTVDPRSAELRKLVGE